MGINGLMMQKKQCMAEVPRGVGEIEVLIRENEALFVEEFAVN